MSVPSAYLGVIIIWSTTPLAIKWSSEGVGYLFGVSLRMLIGLISIFAILWLMRRPIRWDRDSWLTFLVAGLQIYVAMTATYWAAQHLPSGWISVIFGLSPIATSLLAKLWLHDHVVRRTEVIGAVLGVSGLALIFADSFQLSLLAAWAVGAMLLAVFTHSAGAVVLKRLKSGVDGMAVTAGGLLVATPLFAINWVIGDGHLPVNADWHNLGPIIYLGIFGSALGFSMYFYLLKAISVRAVALITLLTPVLALWLGQSLNGEPLTAHTLMGSAIILTGLATSQLGGQTNNS